ncbi:MAG: T9SS type A sorting domain-containing protein [Lewinellaceae bacterium]|nr:T9SS type A sorting domain-containing protein [Lewinellaceae bacterium]
MQPFYRFCSFLFFFLTATILSAQTISWQALNGPHGVDRLLSLSDDNDGRVFAYVNETLYNSTDNGDSWAPCMTGIAAGSITKFKSFQKPLSGPLYLFYKNNLPGSVVRYVPGTNSWATVSLPYGGHFVEGFEVDPQGHFWVFTHEYHGLLHFSADGGQSYAQLTTDGQLPGNFEQLAAFNEAHCLIAMSVGAAQTVYHVNQGGSIQPVVNSTSLLYLGYNPASGTAFYSDGTGFNRSTDGGLSWQKVTTLPSQAANQHINNLIFGATGEIWATTLGGFTFYSADDGLSWSEYPNLKSLFSYYIRTDAGTWFVINGCGFPQFGRSTDLGATWVDISDRFTFPIVEDIKKDAAGNLYAWTCRRDGYEISTDEGQNWSDYTILDGAPLKVNSLAVRSDGMMLALGENAKPYRSIDNGTTWAKIPDIAPPFGPVSTLNRFYTGRDGQFYFFDAFSFDVFKSEDNGDTWQKLNIYFPRDCKPVFHPNGDIFFIDHFLYRYDANADNTAQLFVPSNPLLLDEEIHCTPTGNVFLAVTSGQVFRKLSGNSALELLPFFADKEVYKFESNLEGDVFAFSSKGLFRSDDGGSTWVNVGNTPKQPWKISAAYVASDQYIYTAFYGDVIHRSAQPVAETNRVSGRVWVDGNDNCLYDTGESSNLFAAVTASGNGNYTSFSAHNGNYILTVPNGNYQLNVKAPNALFEPCVSDVPIGLSGPNDSVTVDLPLKIVAACPYLTVNLSAPLLRRCFDVNYLVFYKNEGTAPAPGAYVEVSLDSFFIFQNSSVPVAAQNGLVYRFDLGTLEPGQSDYISIWLNISCDAALGQTHCMSAHIFPDQLCLPTLQDRTQYSECRENIGAYDPNDKRAFVNGTEEPGYVLPNTEIEYLIRFQNTGTDTAFQVVVEDRLSTLLDLTSLRLIGSSHPFTLELRDQRLLRFVFNNIMLPDSNINEPASHGFIKFAIAQMPDLPLGSLIQNGASIFFDFNEPVRTNDSKLILGTVHQKPEPGSLYRVNAWPNPFEHLLMFDIDGPDLPGLITLRLFDALGQQRVQETFSGKNHTIQRQGLEPGLYYFILEYNEQRLATGRVVAR